MTAASIANNVRPEIDVSQYFVHAENVRYLWIVLLMVCVCHVKQTFIKLRQPLTRLDYTDIQSCTTHT